MRRQELISILEEYRRPVSPMYNHHFQKLPSGILRKRNVRTLIGILNDKSLPPIVRENAAGALGEIGDERAIRHLIEAVRQCRIRRGAAVALGRMRARDAAKVLKELAPRVKAAQWALSRLGVAASVSDVMDDLRLGALRLIPHKLRSLPHPLRKKVETQIIRQFRDSIVKNHEDLRWYVTALSMFSHPDAPPLLVRTLERSWRTIGPVVGLRTKRSCCGCLHLRTLRALRTNPSLDAIPNLILTITNRYQRHALLALKRLRELESSLSDPQIARMIKKNAAIRDPIGSKRQHIQTLTHLVRFAGDRGGKECKRTLENLKGQNLSESTAQAIETVIRLIDLRL